MKIVNRYTKEHLEWAKDMYLNTNIPIRDIASRFNDKFNPKHKVNEGMMLHIIFRNCGIKKSQSSVRKQYHFYTEEEKKWLLEKIYKTDLTYKEIADLFNENFGLIGVNKVSGEAIKNLHNLRNDDRFKPNRGVNKGCYGHGKTKESKPIGTIYHRGIGKNGREFYTAIKVRDEHCGNNNFVPLHRYLYEKAYGKIKDDEIVIFIDGNKNNFELSNLMKISRKQNALIAKYGFHKKGIITSAFIECVKLEETMKEMAKGK